MFDGQGLVNDSHFHVRTYCGQFLKDFICQSIEIPIKSVKGPLVFDSLINETANVSDSDISSLTEGLTILS
jgi:hypothetical protein